MRALTLVADRRLELADVSPPPAPAAGEVQIRITAVGLNHIDLWGYRGMAFAKRKLPLVVGAGAIGLSTVAALAARGVSPIVVLFWQFSGCPSAQVWHRPQGIEGQTVTRCPRESEVTSGATAVMRPANSCPSVRGISGRIQS